MAGFDKWQCGKDAITTVQTRPYSWSAVVPVELKAAEVSAFNVVLSAAEDINGKLDKIAQVLEATDRAQLNLAYKRFVELQKKTQYDDIDKIQALKFLDYVLY